MFTTAHPRVATPLGGTATRENIGGKAKRIGATVTALALGGAFALAAPFSASAAEVPESYAEGQFLSGTLLGMDLDQVLALESAEAWNDGTQPTQTSKDPLDADVIQTIEVESNPAPQIDIGDVLQLGAVAQYATARSDGSSYGASGAVNDDGAIGVGEDQSTPPANATFDLQALLGAEFASTLLDLKLELEAISASATGNLDTASGDYTLAGAKLTFTSPAIADLTPKVDAALQKVVDVINQLIGSNGALIDDVNGLLLGLDPLLNLAGGGAHVTVSIDTGNLYNLVHSILQEEYGNSAVFFDLETGEVTVDLAELLGGDLNDLPPGTELLTDAVVNQILNGITSTVSTIADQIVDKVRIALHDATVDIHADLSVNVAQAPLVQEVCQLVDHVLTTPVLRDATNLEKITNGLLLDVSVLLNTGVLHVLTDANLQVGDFVLVNGVIQRITGFVNQTVQENVCNTTSSALAPLTTSVVLDIEATIDELLNGVAARAVADVDILGISTNLDLSVLLDGLGDTLFDGLFDGDGAVADLIEALNTGLVHPATEALLGTGDGTIGDALRDVLSIKVNIQELSLASSRGMAAMVGQIFTETAVRVTVLGSSVAVVNLAQASVGPNITRIIDEDCTDPDGCDQGGETVTPPGGGGGGSLAFTGIGIATLLAVILALLAAGAYLVRESYRRNHSVGTE